MKVGDRVRMGGGPFAGREGVVEKVLSKAVGVRIRGKLIYALPSALQVIVDEPQDFDGGFGVGGLARHEEPPIIPTNKAIDKVQDMARRAKRCRKCGQTDVLDGAMFTTGGSDVCDDCCG